MYEGRRTPLKQLMKRLGVTEYDHTSDFSSKQMQPIRVVIPLSQHIGTPALPTVQVGEKVVKGQCIGDIPDGKSGARIHASISGIVRSVNHSIVIERA